MHHMKSTSGLPVVLGTSLGKAEMLGYASQSGKYHDPHDALCVWLARMLARLCHNYNGHLRDSATHLGGCRRSRDASNNLLTPCSRHLDYWIRSCAHDEYRVCTDSGGAPLSAAQCTYRIAYGASLLCQETHKATAPVGHHDTAEDRQTHQEKLHAA